MAVACAQTTRAVALTLGDRWMAAYLFTPTIAASSRHFSSRTTGALPLRISARALASSRASPSRSNPVACFLLVLHAIQMRTCRLCTCCMLRARYPHITLCTTTLRAAALRARKLRARNVTCCHYALPRYALPHCVTCVSVCWLHSSSSICAVGCEHGAGQVSTWVLHAHCMCDTRSLPVGTGCSCAART